MDALRAELGTLRQERSVQREEEERRLGGLRDRARGCIQKLIQAEEASESAYTCLHCLRPFERPVVCVPCGHTFCDACVDKARDDTNDMLYCRECKAHCAHEAVAVVALDVLSGKFVYRRQVLSSLLTDVLKG